MKEALFGAITASLVYGMLTVGLVMLKPEAYGRWLAKIDVAYDVVMSDYSNP